MASFDAKKLSGLDWTIVGAAIVAFLAIFFPWYGVSAGGFSASVSGWSTTYGWLGALVIVAAGAYLLAHRSGVDTSKIAIGPAKVVLILSAIGTLVVIIRWITLPSGSFGFGSGSTSVFSYGPRIGLFLALIAGLVQVGGSFALFRKSEESSAPSE